MTKITKKQLIQKYLKEKLSQQKIADFFGCSQTHISHLLKRYNIKIRQYNKLVNMVGKKYYKFTVLKRLNKTGNTIWICECDCGNIRNVNGSDLKSGNHKSCGQCDCHIFIQGSWWGEIQKNARRRGLKFELTKDYLYDLWKKQDGKCAMSGIKLYMPQKAREQRGPKCTASIDRIDNSIGYVVNNVQWVHKTVNKMHREYSISEYINMCELVVNNRRSVLCKPS